MVYLRATQKVLRWLPPRAPEGRTSSTALGDWFMNRLVLNRQPLLLLVSGSSLLPILRPARDLRALPSRLPAIVRSRLVRLGTDPSVIDAEIDAMREVLVAGTNDRSVVGTMVDFARDVPYHLPERARWSEEDLLFAEARLAVTPCRGSGPDAVFPDQEAAALLAARWAGERDRQ